MQADSYASAANAACCAGRFSFRNEMETPPPRCLRHTRDGRPADRSRSECLFSAGARKAPPANAAACRPPSCRLRQ
jgi:hypothetical protein